MQVDEVSSFAAEVEVEEEAQKQMFAEELAKARTETLAQRTTLTQKYNPISIDSSAVKYYFKSLRNAIQDDDSFWQNLELMTEIIITERDECSEEPYK
jgi:hypothetical protein